MAVTVGYSVLTTVVFSHVRVFTSPVLGTHGYRRIYRHCRRRHRHKSQGWTIQIKDNLRSAPIYRRTTSTSDDTVQTCRALIYPTRYLLSPECSVVSVN